MPARTFKEELKADRKRHNRASFLKAMIKMAYHQGTPQWKRDIAFKAILRNVLDVPHR